MNLCCKRKQQNTRLKSRAHDTTSKVIFFARLKAKVKNLKKESQNIIEASKKSEQILT